MDSSNFEETFAEMFSSTLRSSVDWGIGRDDRVWNYNSTGSKYCFILPDDVTHVLQAYFYYMSFPKDEKSTKMLGIGHDPCCSHHYPQKIYVNNSRIQKINGFTDHSVLISGNWSLFLSIAINVTLAFIVQLFFTQRIFILCPDQKRYWVASVIGIFVFAHFDTVINLFIKRRFILLKEVSLTSALPFGVTTIISDILIAVALCALLSSNRSSFQDTNNVINRLIIFAVNRCILTCAMAIVETIVFSTLPNSFYSLALDFVIGKLYANSLLAVLNARANLRPDPQQDLSSTELSTAFNFTSITNHHTSLIQVRSRENFRNHVGTNFEKREPSNVRLQSEP
ncbi:hypothetical protein BJ912DRAFT_1129664 [Pholiota molesta]|nr:hypothetical protein BJ912DRAFT_1129664 [Pholiota molesta]